MQVAKAFVKDMRAYFAEKNATKRDETVGNQLEVLRQYQLRRAKTLRLPDIYQVFEQMKDHA